MLTMHLSRSQADLDSELAAAEPEAVAPEAAPAAKPVKTLDLGDDAGWGDDGVAEAAPGANMENGVAGEGVSLMHSLQRRCCIAPPAVATRPAAGPKVVHCKSALCVLHE